MGVSDQTSKVALAGTAILGLAGLLWYFLIRKKPSSGNETSSAALDDAPTASRRESTPTVVLTQSSEDGKGVSLLHSSSENSPTHSSQTAKFDNQSDSNTSDFSNSKSESVEKLVNALDTVFEKANNNKCSLSEKLDSDEVIINSLPGTSSQETPIKTEVYEGKTSRLKSDDPMITPQTSSFLEQDCKPKEEIICDDIKSQKAVTLQSKLRAPVEQKTPDTNITQENVSKQTKRVIKNDIVSTEDKENKDNENADQTSPLTSESYVKTKVTPSSTTVKTDSISSENVKDNNSLHSPSSSKDDSLNNRASDVLTERTRSQSGNGNVSDPCHSSDSGVSVQSEAEASGTNANRNSVGASGDHTQQTVSGAQSKNKEPEINPNVYEFDFPSHLCGLLIGSKGKHIKAIMKNSGTSIALNPKLYDQENQKCTIKGQPDQIKSALRMIKDKFPPKRTGVDYSRCKPEHPMLSPEMMQLSLPQGVSVDAIVSSVVTANHIFLQQPTHPSFHLLQRQNQCMMLCYGQDSTVPELPRPIEAGVICAAPMYNGWYRGQVVQTYPERDECDIRFVDYGGYMKMPGNTVKQIRSDFTQLPFQAVECYLAHVIPPNDASEFGVEANAVLEQMVQGQILQAEMVGHESDGVPYVQLYLINGDKIVFVNRELVNKGVARWVEMGV